MYFLHQHSRAIIANSLPKVPTKGDKPAPVIVKFISLSYRPAGFIAGASGFKITVKGKPSHGAYPWLSVDPILVASQIVVSFQQIVSRNIKLTDNAAVVTIGAINGGNRGNIIPEQVEMLGTVRTLSNEDEELIFNRVRQNHTPQFMILPLN